MSRTTRVTAHRSADHAVQQHTRRLPDRRENSEAVASLDQAPALTTVSELTGRRGWTKAAVARFLGEPDQVKPNPRYANAAPMRLYDVARIQAVEDTVEWAAWMEKSAKRSSAAQAAAEATAEKRAAVSQAEADSLIAQMAELDGGHSMGGFILPVAREWARSHYDQLWLQRFRGSGEPKSVDDDAPAHFIDRITVNYLRHEHTDYDYLLNLAGKNDIARRWLRNHVLDQIARRFPELADECDRQRYSEDLYQNF
jgi:hypothetical protein